MPPLTPQIDLPSDLNVEDDNGQNWAVIGQARNPSQIRVGALVVAGMSHFWSVVRITAVEGPREWRRHRLAETYQLRFVRGRRPHDGHVADPAAADFGDQLVRRIGNDPRLVGVEVHRDPLARHLGQHRRQTDAIRHDSTVFLQVSA